MVTEFRIRIGLGISFEIVLVSEFWFKIGVRFDTGFKLSCRISGCNSFLSL